MRRSSVEFLTYTIIWHMLECRSRVKNIRTVGRPWRRGSRDWVPGQWGIFRRRKQPSLSWFNAQQEAHEWYKRARFVRRLCLRKRAPGEGATNAESSCHIQAERFPDRRSCPTSCRSPGKLCQNIDRLFRSHSPHLIILFNPVLNLVRKRVTSDVLQMYMFMRIGSL